MTLTIFITIHEFDVVFVSFRIKQQKCNAKVFVLVCCFGYVGHYTPNETHKKALLNFINNTK